MAQIEFLGAAMTKLNGFVLITVAALGSIQASAALPPESLEVLGIHLADDRSSAESNLKNAGFVAQPGDINCEKNHTQIVSYYVTRNDRQILPGRLTCIVSYQKGNDNVKVGYLIAPHGPVVYEVEYSFRSGETFSQIQSRLRSKFGEGTKSPMLGATSHYWFTDARAERAEPYLSYLQASSHNITMTGGVVMEETFREETQKMIAARLANSKPANL